MGGPNGLHTARIWPRSDLSKAGTCLRNQPSFKMFWAIPSQILDTNWNQSTSNLASINFTANQCLKWNLVDSTWGGPTVRVSQLWRFRRCGPESMAGERLVLRQRLAKSSIIGWIPPMCTLVDHIMCVDIYIYIHNYIYIYIYICVCWLKIKRCCWVSLDVSLCSPLYFKVYWFETPFFSSLSHIGRCCWSDNPKCRKVESVCFWENAPLDI